MSETEFFTKLAQNPRPVVVDFWAPWCGPCRAIEPMLKKAGAEYDGRVDVWRVNADEHPEVMRSLRIYGIPTLIGFHAGKEIARQTGVGSPQALAALFETALSGEQPVETEPNLSLLDRGLRLVIGLALLFLAYVGNFNGIYLLIAAAGGLVAFSAVYDRCPVWQAIKARLNKAHG